jgi:hypothetical protein
MVFGTQKNSLLRCLRQSSLPNDDSCLRTMFLSEIILNGWKIRNGNVNVYSQQI